MNANQLKKRKNKPVKTQYPNYQFHVSESVVYTEDNRMLSTIILEGLPFESVTDAVLENAFHNVKDFLVGAGKDGELYLWTHLVRERVSIENEYKFQSEFLNRFSEKYISTFKNGDFYKSTWYITFGMPFGQVDAGVERMHDLVDQALVAFKVFNPSVLSVGDNFISETAEYLSSLCNKEHVRIPASSTPISDSIVNSEWYFGNDVLELRNNESDKKIFATNYVIKDFPMFTKPEHWNFLLSLPYEFVITQSFIFESPSKTLRKIDSQKNKLTSAGDAAITQQEELSVGQEAVVSGDTVFGSYHCALTVYGSTPDNARANGKKVSAEFITSGQGFRFARVAAAAPFVFFSHLPLNKKRPLDSRRTITNLACTFSMHNYSVGKKEGNPIGDGKALMPLKTLSDGLYYYNTHYTELHRNMVGQKIAGHLLLLGATGAGKTTFEGASAAYVQRFDSSLFIIDFNRSTELFARTFGASYFTLDEGRYSGLNPFQIADADDPVLGGKLIAFLKQYVKIFARDAQGNPCSDEESEILSGAVDAVMELPRESRRVSKLLQKIPSGSDLAIKFQKWCNNGEFALWTDSPTNKFNPLELQKVGFDTTVLLEKTPSGGVHPACEPVLAVLFFYKTIMQREGKLMLSIIEEFWMPCNFPTTQAQIKSSLKAGRLKNEMMWLTSQSPEDAINCQIFPAIVQQTATKVFLPNPDAEFEGYKKVGLTEKEFNRLKRLGKESRTMLIKQSGASVFAKMDLYGFDEFLPIFSGTTEGIALAEKIRSELNTENPDVWVPEFIRRIKG
ncbi:conjugal transfer protein [Salmonella enterica]|nr:conjugal transfer protein [Salmonella enterica]